MTDDPRDDAPRRNASWRARYDSARARGVPLESQGEQIEGVRSYPTDYAAGHLLVSAAGEALPSLLDLLGAAAGDFGWGIELQNIDGSPLEVATAQARADRARERLNLPTIHRVRIFPAPRPDRDDQPVPPVDAWRLLQRARARGGRKLPGVSLDHVMSVDPFGGKTNPFGGKTNPFGGKTNSPGIASYGHAGLGARQVVDFIGAEPRSRYTLGEGGRRPVVAVLDTGCGEHLWLPDEVVTRHPVFDGRAVGVSSPADDPEAVGDVSGPFDGEIDASAGHGTFIAGIVRQACPDAEIIAVRVADSQGTLLEGDFMLAVRTLVKWMTTPVADGGRPIDVMNLSLGYYHETPDDELFDSALGELLVAARRHGCAVVCSAGNDATDRPAFPAALWAWPGADFRVDDPVDAAPHLAIGALNPNGTVALFSNIGPWVSAYAPGASVLSTHPPFRGGAQSATRDDRDGMRRETIDPDDYSGGFALWSGTSFAAPLVAARLADHIAERLMAGPLDDADRARALVDAAERTRAVFAPPRSGR